MKFRSAILAVKGYASDLATPGSSSTMQAEKSQGFGDEEKFIDGNAYLIGPGFSEQLQAKPKLTREVRNEMRAIIAKQVPRVPPASD